MENLEIMDNKNKKDLPKTAQHKNNMIKALEKCMGIVSKASLATGTGRRTHYMWMADDPEYKARVEACRNIVLDFAESALHEQISEGNPTSTIFLLKTLGKARGYIEKTEVDNNHKFVGSPKINFED